MVPKKAFSAPPRSFSCDHTAFGFADEATMTAEPGPPPFTVARAVPPCENASLFEFFLCLFRACLGKLITLSIAISKMARKRYAFFAPMSRSHLRGRTATALETSQQSPNQAGSRAMH
eukprot:COSAG06_NODE_848_length_11971_cov_10.199882_16_plen_118_part_00